MKDFLRFLRRHRKDIQSYTVLALVAVVLALTLIHIATEAINTTYIFFSVAIMMVAIAVQYASQKKKKKKVGILIFYCLTAAVCVAIGLVLHFMPPPV